MAQGAKSKEPSMEEILASIRRIIAEDDSEKSAQRPAEAASVELNPDSAASVEPERAMEAFYSPPAPESPAAKAGALSGTAKAARSSTIFDLTEPMASSPSQSAAPAVDSSPAPVPPAPIDRAVANEAVTQSGGAQDDERNGLMPSILSGTAKAARSSSVLDLTEPMASSPFQSATAAVDSIPVPVPPAPIDQVVTNEAVPQSGGAGGARDDERSGLMSGATSAAFDSAFNALAQTVLVDNARTLEDLVREMLRPMLKVWLDDNVPAIVERLVRAEIERVSRGRGG